MPRGSGNRGIRRTDRRLRRIWHSVQMPDATLTRLSGLQVISLYLPDLRSQKRDIQQSNIVLDTQLHHCRFLLALMVLILRFSFLAISVTRKPSQTGAALHSLLARDACHRNLRTDFFQQARNAFRGKFLPFLSAARAFGRSVGAPCFSTIPSYPDPIPH